MLSTMLGNKWTTMIGVVTGVSQYLATAGAKAPSTPAEWASFILGLGLVVLGVIAKDATTGSKPGQ